MSSWTVHLGTPVPVTPMPVTPDDIYSAATLIAHRVYDGDVLIALSLSAVALILLAIVFMLLHISTRLRR